MNNLTKGKAAEKKELGYSARNIPRGSQSRTENIIAQFCRTPHPPRKKQMLPQVARVMNKVGE